MSLISYPFVRQYFWYYKKVNTEYFGRTLPILHVKYKYHIYYTDDDMKLFKKVNLSFPIEETCHHNDKKYYVGTFLNNNHDDVTSKLKTLCKIVYIDIDDKSIWKIREEPLKNDKMKETIFTKIGRMPVLNNLFNATGKNSLQETFAEFAVELNVPVVVPVVVPAVVPLVLPPMLPPVPSPMAPPVAPFISETSYEKEMREFESPLEESIAIHEDDTTKLSIIEDYYSRSNEIDVVMTEIKEDTRGVRYHEEVFDDDEFIIIDANTADI